MAVFEKADLSYYIPRQLDDGAKSLFREMDVAMIGLMGVLVGIGSGLPVIGLLPGIGATFFYRKLEAGECLSMAIHSPYQLTGFPEPEELPGGHIQELNGQGLHMLWHQIK